MALGTENNDSSSPQSLQTVSIIVDGVPLQVPGGSNLIEAIKCGGTEVPHYCYHPDLSIAGNCRMCQVQVKGQPKLTIACNTIVQEGMEVFTHKTSKEVESAQAATLEFILINHPLDCTVCDQAGHCKLQDYHYEYNARSSRFVEEKEHKVKAVPLGDTVMLDGERCIMCTRCIRFCDEVPQTSELGMLNRGDRSVIAINPLIPLANPFSGTVVDLCPVGALTHRKWRFNTRIWFTSQTDSICPGCSTGCNVRVAVRDNKVVQVKARRNVEVNKEWLCDEGRYGYDRFIPRTRVQGGFTKDGSSFSPTEIADKTSLSGSTIALVSPDLVFEDYAAIKVFLDEICKEAIVAIDYKERSLTPTEEILISPDYACNFQGAIASGLVGNQELETQYYQALKAISDGVTPTGKAVANILLFGDRSISAEDCTFEVLQGLSRAKTIFLGSDALTPAINHAAFVVGIPTILESSGILVNRRGRAQYHHKVMNPPHNTEPVWKILNAWLKKLRKGQKSFLAPVTNDSSDRDVTLSLLSNYALFNNVSLAKVKLEGMTVNSTVA